MPDNISPKTVSFMRYFGKYCKARQVTDDNIIQRRKDACSMHNGYLRLQIYTQNM